MSNNSPANDHFVNGKRALLIRKAINDNNHTSDFNNLSEKGHIVNGKRAFLIGVPKKGGGFQPPEPLPWIRHCTVYKMSHMARYS